MRSSSDLTNDPLERVADLRPSDALIQNAWTQQRRADVLSAVIDGTARVRTTYAVKRRWTLTAPVAASVAVVGIVAAATMLARSDGGQRGQDTPALGGEAGISGPFTATAETPRVGPHQWAYRAFTTYGVGSDRGPFTSAAWVAPNGSMWFRQPDRGDNVCSHIPVSQGATGFDQPDQAFLDRLPTDPAALQTYLQNTVQGSTSREEAVFTAAGDLLRDSDGLASSTLRAAYVTVLSRLGRVTVHNDTDKLGRAAFRVDFVDPKERPGELQSLYFDRSTFQLLEERDGSLPGPSRYNGPSPAYDSVPSAHPTVPSELGPAGGLTVMTEEKVVDAVPPNCGLK